MIGYHQVYMGYLIFELSIHKSVLDEETTRLLEEKWEVRAFKNLLGSINFFMFIDIKLNLLNLSCVNLCKIFHILLMEILPSVHKNVLSAISVMGLDVKCIILNKIAEIIYWWKLAHKN